MTEAILPVRDRFVHLIVYPGLWHLRHAADRFSPGAGAHALGVTQLLMAPEPRPIIRLARGSITRRIAIHESVHAAIALWQGEQRVPLSWCDEGIPHAVDDVATAVLEQLGRWRLI